MWVPCPDNKRFITNLTESSIKQFQLCALITVTLFQAVTYSFSKIVCAKVILLLPMGSLDSSVSGYTT